RDIVVVVVFFFFSSRRRHTRFSRDWSSDVCSSDLFPCQDISVAGAGKGLEGERSGLFFEIMRLAKEIKPKFLFLENVPAITHRRSEERRVGKECRSRWTTYY